MGCGVDNSPTSENPTSSTHASNEAVKVEQDSEKVSQFLSEEQNENTNEEVSNTGSLNDKTIMTKEESLKKLDDTEESVTELKEIAENGNQSEMNKAQDEIYQIWDKAMNEVYSELESQLSKEEMDVLRVEQRKWIEERDIAAENASDEYMGGSLAPFVYSKSLAEWTKERSYTLVNNYMN